MSAPNADKSEDLPTVTLGARHTKTSKQNNRESVFVTSKGGSRLSHGICRWFGVPLSASEI